MISQIIKRDGSVQPFNAQKIVMAITKAGVATDTFNKLVAEEIYRQSIEPTLQKKTGTVGIEEIQDLVEKALFNTGFEEAHKAFVLYRDNRKKQRENKKVMVDVESSIDEYITQSDWRVNANANQGYSLGGMILNVAGKVTANYWLSYVYPEEVGLAHRNGDYHIHDLDMLTGYCCGHSLRALLNEGFNGVANKVESAPPKHLSSALMQMVNFLGSLQNEWSGAQAFSSFDTYLAPFVRVDKLSYSEVKQAMQEFVFSMNAPSRWGNQTIFSNLTFDLHCPDDLRDQYPLVGGEEVDFTYGELQEEMDMLNRAYMEIMVAGDSHGRVFTFPIPTYNITKDFDWNGKNTDLLFEMTAKYGLPYFQNFTNSDLDPHMIRSMCPLSGDTWVRVKVDGEEKRGCLGWIASLDKPFAVPYGGKWHKAKVISIPEQDSVRVFFKNGKFTDFGVHHLQPVYRDGKFITIEIAELLMTDKIPFDRWDKTVGYVGLTLEKAELVEIERIQKLGMDDDLYCFEVENSEHLFVLNNGLITHNCRLRLDLTELLRRGNGLFGSAEQTGSVGVVTINCARLGYLFKHDKEGLYKRLDYLLELAKTSLELKRKTITRLLKAGLYPYTKRYIGSYRNFFSTIGVNGVNEMIRNFTEDTDDITTDFGHKMAVDLLNHVRDKVTEFQKETGNMYNIEASPAEGCTHRFAKEDIKRFPDIIHAGTDTNPYYTNSTQLPVNYTDDPFEALEMQEESQCLYTGGCIEKGNYVITNKGRLLIEDIVANWDSLKDNLEVVSYNVKAHKSEWKKVTDAIKIDVSKHDKIHITGERGLNIVTSDWHPFFVVNKKTFLVEEKRADELQKDDWILQNKDRLVPEKSDSRLTFDTAYLIGYFMGNGSMSATEDNRGGNHIPRTVIRFHDGNKNILARVSKILNNNFETDIHHCTRETDSQGCHVSTVKYNVADFFKKYGFKAGRKCYTVGISEELRKDLTNQEVISGLLSGFIDSDGYIEAEGDLEYSTVSERLAQDIVEMFNLLGVIASYKPKFNVRENEAVLYRVRVCVFELSKIWDLLKTTTPRLVKGEHKKYSRQLPVVRVQEVSKTDVQDNQFYDLTVEDNHNYLCGKQSYVFIHNTVLHLYMNERISTPEMCKQIVKRALTNYRLPYITITPTFSICPKHGYIAGEHKFCPKCDEELIAKKRSACKCES